MSTQIIPEAPLRVDEQTSVAQWEDWQWQDDAAGTAAPSGRAPKHDAAALLDEIHRLGQSVHYAQDVADTFPHMAGSSQSLIQIEAETREMLVRAGILPPDALIVLLSYPQTCSFLQDLCRDGDIPLTRCLLRSAVIARALGSGEEQIAELVQALLPETGTPWANTLRSANTLTDTAAQVVSQGGLLTREDAIRIIDQINQWLAEDGKPHPLASVLRRFTRETTRAYSHPDVLSHLRGICGGA